MPPAILAALPGGGGVTSHAKYLFSAAPSSPSFNDPLPSPLSPLSLPKPPTRRAPHSKPSKGPTSQSLSLHNRSRKSIDPISPTVDDLSGPGPSGMSFSFRIPPAKLQNPNPGTPKRAAFKATHMRTRYHKPVCPREEPIVLSSEESARGNRSVIVGPSGVSYRLPDAPFEFQFSYSETPRVAPIAIREPAFLPFAPPSMPRPWTGKAPLLSKKEKQMKKGKKFRLVEPLGFGASSSEVKESGLVREVLGKKGLSEHLRLGMCKVVDSRSREEILGEPLSRFEIRNLVKPHISHNRQVNLGRDGLTHNMLELVHTHWRRDEICKVRCRGVPTIDMDNICQCLEEKTGGKVVHRVGGIVFLFRGRYYDTRTRPRYPTMLWKPAAPVYPKLIQQVPEGLTREEAAELREKGEKLLPICKLAKNGIYINLVKDVKDAFEGCELVKIDCEGMNPSDHKKLGAKLKELVPCVLLSFDKEKILIYRGKGWKSQYPSIKLNFETSESNLQSDSNISDQSTGTSSTSMSVVTIRKAMSPKMLSLWRHAIDSSKALLLDELELDLCPDSLLERVEDFESTSQAMEHSFPALIVTDAEEGKTKSDDDDDDANLGEEPNDTVPFGFLPIDMIVSKLGQI
ncbi:CRS2-associated factor 2 [Carex littledalei]|uniref:CRS2-associated factor 2 n=1 Tax=Carex littledalei TaxID=544730 RepID=A0A833VV55_9POAL|nr:CRS2-associated factor 2 [Carex littledalei]